MLPLGSSLTKADVILFNAATYLSVTGCPERFLKRKRLAAIIQSAGPKSGKWNFAGNKVLNTHIAVSIAAAINRSVTAIVCVKPLFMGAPSANSAEHISICGGRPVDFRRPPSLPPDAWRQSYSPRNKSALGGFSTSLFRAIISLGRVGIRL